VRLAGSSFNGIHLRKDPPLDYAYLATTWLLDSLAASKTRVFNAPAAVRSINEKLGIFLFPDDSHPALVSADPQQLVAYLRNDCHGDAISKPLDSFGGRGVERISLSELSDEQAAALLASHTEQGQRLRMLQPFCPEIFTGEVRAFAVGGTVLAWCLKRPAAGSYLANTRTLVLSWQHVSTALPAACGARLGLRL
jgi:glutathione synthase